MYGFEILHKNDRKVETISQKPLGLIPMFVGVTGKKLVGEGGIYSKLS